MRVSVVRHESGRKERLGMTRNKDGMKRYGGKTSVCRVSQPDRDTRQTYSPCGMRRFPALLFVDYSTQNTRQTNFCTRKKIWKYVKNCA